MSFRLVESRSCRAWVTGLFLLRGATSFADNTLTLPFGHQKVMTYRALKEAASSDPAVVEAHLLGREQVLIGAVGIGKTTVTLTLKKGPAKTLAVIVTGRRLIDLAPDERVEMVQGTDDCLSLPNCVDIRFQLEGETGVASSAPEVVKPLVYGRELRLVFGAPGEATVSWASPSGPRLLKVRVRPKP